MALSAKEKNHPTVRHPSIFCTQLCYRYIRYHLCLSIFFFFFLPVPNYLWQPGQRAAQPILTTEFFVFLHEKQSSNKLNKLIPRNFFFCDKWNPPEHAVPCCSSSSPQMIGHRQQNLDHQVCRKAEQWPSDEASYWAQCGRQACLSFRPLPPKPNTHARLMSPWCLSENNGCLPSCSYHTSIPKQGCSQLPNHSFLTHMQRSRTFRNCNHAPSH